MLQVGYRKIGQCCPARLAATEEKLTDGTTRIRVDAILDHYGHEEELNHISFSKGEKSLLYGWFMLVFHNFKPSGYLFYLFITKYSAFLC